jgi:hypothetical protein
LTTDILCALGPDGGHASILPSLRHLRAQKPIVMHGPSWDAVQSFITSRSISGRPVQVDAPSYQCHICHVSSEEPQGLKLHLRDNHRYQILCSYCDDFECTSVQNDLFREHLESKHPEIARMDALISSPSIRPFQLNSLLGRHSSLRAPASARLSTTHASPSLGLLTRSKGLLRNITRRPKNHIYYTPPSPSSPVSLVPSHSSSEDFRSYVIGD